MQIWVPGATDADMGTGGHGCRYGYRVPGMQIWVPGASDADMGTGGHGCVLCIAQAGCWDDRMYGWEPFIAGVRTLGGMHDRLK